MLKKPKNDAEIIKDFIKVDKAQDSTCFLVKGIYWDGPADPRLYWRVAANLRNTSTKPELKEKIQEILNDEAYFGIYVECNERNLEGWMCGRTLCQGCAERNHGVVY